jgi:uncharacterized SAM-binding protein YcdF (DUF218 family)
LNEPVIERLKFLKRSKRAKRWLIAIICLVLVYFLTPVLLNQLARWLIREDQLVKSDVIVALAGDHRNHREKRAAELYHQGWANKVVVSGLKHPLGFHTGEIAKKYVMSLGVSEMDISMITETLNTRAEAVALEKLMRDKGWRSAIIVTSAFHSRRAAYTVEKAARDLTFHSSPVAAVAPEWEPRDWWSRREDAFITTREFVSWANTLVNGWQ